MDDGGPALEFVMSGAVKQIGSANGDARASSLDNCERGVIIDRVVGNQGFLTSSPAHVECGKIIQRARRPDACKKPGVAVIPEPMPFTLAHLNCWIAREGRADRRFHVLRSRELLRRKSRGAESRKKQRDEDGVLHALRGGPGLRCWASTPRERSQGGLPRTMVPNFGGKGESHCLISLEPRVDLPG